MQTLLHFSAAMRAVQPLQKEVVFYLPTKKLFGAVAWLRRQSIVLQNHNSHISWEEKDYQDTRLKQ